MTSNSVLSARPKPDRLGWPLRRLVPGVVLQRLLWLSIWLLATGCTPQLIANRNQQVVDDITALQKQTDLFLIRLQRVCGTPAGTYTNNAPQHDELRAAASSLQVRVNAIPKNTKTAEQVMLLRDSYDKLEALHKTGCIPGAIESARTLLNSQFTSLITLEEAKAKQP